MGIITSIEASKRAPFVAFNTGTNYDLMVGSMVRSADNKHWLLDGGLSPIITGIHGGGGMYKSTFAGSLIMRLLGIYRDAEAVILDSEAAILRDPDRLSRFAGEYTVDLETQVLGLSSTNYDIGGFYEKVKEVCALKEKNRKDLIIETPFLDITTGKKLRTWAPTIVFIDSLTELSSNEEEQMLATKGLDDQKIKTLFMIDGNKKTILIRSLRRFCEQYGLCVVATAHFGKVVNMEGMPQPKQLQYMKQDYKIKGAGSKFEFLTGNLLQTLSAKRLTDSNNEAQYPLGSTNAQDINEVTVMVQRCKTNAAGMTAPFIVSQSNGLLNEVSHYHYLRNHKDKASNDPYYGLAGSVQHQSSVLLPDEKFTRTTIREKAKDNYPLRRALELTSQLLFLQQNWNIGALPFDASHAPHAFFDRITKSGSIKMEDVLNSTGCWSYVKQERPFMTIFDVLQNFEK